MNWTGKRVLVTGAGGFIGSHLAERLVECGATTRALVHYSALGGRGWLDKSKLAKEMEILSGDIQDSDCVAEALKSIDVVFHLAALIAIPYSYRAPRSYVQTNILGTLNVLQGARDRGVERVVHTSTSEVYGTALRVPIDESHPLQGQSPYSASKIGADKMVEAFHRSFGVPAVIVRPFNTFGPRQSSRAIVPVIISQCLAGDTIRLGSLSPTRDLNFVSNTVDGFLLAGSAPAAVGHSINLGSGREISVGDLAQLIARLVGRDIRIVAEEQRLRPSASEVERLLADAALARSLLGWRPAVDLETGLALSIEWARANLASYRPGEYIV